MNSIINLILGGILGITVIIDCMIMGIGLLTVINSFICGSNIMLYIADKIFVPQEKAE